MSEFGSLGKAGKNAVDLTSVSRTQRPEIRFRSGGMFCTCDDLMKGLLRDTSDDIIARGGCTALVVLAGTYAGRVMAKSKHKDGEITCYTYRKIKDMVNSQPWFTIPLIAVPVMNYSLIRPWRPPFAVSFIWPLRFLPRASPMSYALMVGGWMLNTTGHVLVISSKDERFKKYTVPTSIVAWGLSILVAVLGAFSPKRSCCC